MAQISSAFREFLDRTLPKPHVGPGYQIQIGSRSAVRYVEGLKQITMFDDIVEDHRPFLGSALSRLWRRFFRKWCLGVYIEEPLVWDNETEPIEADHAQLILRRVEDALKRRSGCYRIERGPNQQHSHPTTNN